ncbi:CTP synthase [Rickettsiales endosymbiont of Peranema trichophorum]|uniref:CTP synthase n=1 Tax=Rickettsiales endosymbiont of Peranema trichophorum TaxID=2486577 RepID=UPI0010231057|nr:CTP synthase [Rickettsiales endosymbiont of Peranema trichophorum]RZI45222.1 CTP synthase [Rickettsiales endosymbiont of Peranema trichophorum]
MTRYVFITGGVVSSLGKGLASASLGALLQARGYSVRLKKLDPYLNVDPGTMSPYQHGEVFVTDDGAETDLDLGHYERFTGIAARKGDSTTAGRIYMELLAKERKGDYLGGTVQVIPHVTNLIKEFIQSDVDNIDFVLCEIGGTVGDIEGLPFFEAIRQFSSSLTPSRSIFVHLTLVPYIKSANESKTKPTQHSVKELRALGIQPNIILCRTERRLSLSDKKKISLLCNVSESAVIEAVDQSNIYAVPIAYHEQGIDEQVLHHFHLPYDIQPNLDKWYRIIEAVKHPSCEVKIAVVGKYNKLKDAYKSLTEALNHGGLHHRCKVKLVWINALTLTDQNAQEKLGNVDGILVPGGFGALGSVGKIAAIKYARLNNIPFFGICLGMQLACIEIARNILNIKNANTTEFEEDCTNIIGLMTEWDKDGKKELRSDGVDLGGTMRLGSYQCSLKEGSMVRSIYGADTIEERHRHRYEFNISFLPRFESSGAAITGVSKDGKLVEIMELKGHPWFIGVQFHPELKSRPFSPHPLFVSFIEAAVKRHTLA